MGYFKNTLFLLKLWFFLLLVILTKSQSQILKSRGFLEKNGIAIHQILLLLTQKSSSATQQKTKLCLYGGIFQLMYVYYSPESVYMHGPFPIPESRFGRYPSACMHGNKTKRTSI